MAQIHLENLYRVAIPWYGAVEDINQGWCPKSGYPSVARSVIHSHSLVQLNSVDQQAVVICLRRCSEQALSRVLAQHSGYLHRYQDWYIQWVQQLQERSCYQKKVMLEWAQAQKPRRYTIDCEELEQLREQAIAWNSQACDLMHGKALALVYENWCQDPHIASRKMHITGDFNRITLKREPLHHLDRVDNREQVQDWLLAHRQQDHELLEKWQSYLLRESP